MNSHRRSNRTRRRAVAALMSLALVGGLVGAFAGPTMAAAPTDHIVEAPEPKAHTDRTGKVSRTAKPGNKGQPACQVENLRTRTKGGSAGVQPLIDAAAAGDTLQIKGECVGALTVSRDLNLVGRASKSAPIPTLDGAQQGSVVLLLDAALTIRDLTLTGGSGTEDQGSTYGGGIEVLSGGSVTLLGSTDITGNHVTGSGGGIDFFSPQGAVEPKSFSISGNARVVGNTQAGGRNAEIYISEWDPSPLNSVTLAGGTFTSLYCSSGAVTATAGTADSVWCERGDTNAISGGTWGSMELWGDIEVTGGTFGSLTGQVGTAGGPYGTVPTVIDGVLTFRAGTVTGTLTASRLDVLGGSVNAVGQQDLRGNAVIAGGSVGTVAGAVVTIEDGASVDTVSVAVGTFRMTGGDVETVTVAFTCSLVEVTGGHIGTLNIGVEGGLITSPAVIDAFNDASCRTTYAFDALIMGEYNWLPANCADLSLTVEQVSPDRVRVTVTNDGPSTATDVRVSVPFAATPHVLLTLGDFTVAFGGLNRASLEPGASASFLIDGLPDAGVQTGVVQISFCNQADPDSIPANSDPTEDDQAEFTVTS